MTEKKMNSYMVILIFLGTLALNTFACTEEEFKALDQETSNQAKSIYSEKKKTFDEYMEKIKAKRNLSTQELYLYRKNMLNHPKAKKLNEKRKIFTIGEMLEISKEHDCKYLQNQFSKSLESTNQQWDIVFEAIEKDLNETQ
jgi:abortive infection bacteriophage resistance protein